MSKRTIMIRENGGNTAREIPFEDLKVGDVFVIYDGDVQYIDAHGRIEWTVAEAPKAGSDGVLFVKVVEDTE